MKEIALFVDGVIGIKALAITLKQKKNISLIVLKDDSQPYKQHIENVSNKKFPIISYSSLLDILSTSQNFPMFDIGILCWWPFIIKKEYFRLSKYGFLNFHPSLLPYNRGKHPNFWNIVDESPYGVSIHWIDEFIDNGALAFQKKIKKTWEDNGQILYEKAIKEILILYRENLDIIFSGNIPRIPLTSNQKVRYSHEMDNITSISLDQSYTARGLLNLLRAKTFDGYLGCKFHENGSTYNVTVKIEKI